MSENNLNLAKKYEYAWDKYSIEDLTNVFALNDAYKDFMSKCKTERECVSEFIARAEKAGFKNVEDIITQKGSLKAGDKVYACNMDKSLALFTIGKKGFEEGMLIL
jgi:aspartyl aminopeptidase